MAKLSTQNTRRQSVGRWPLRYVAVLAALCVASYAVLLGGLRYVPAEFEIGARSMPPSDLRAWAASGTGILFDDAASGAIARLRAPGAGPGADTGAGKGAGKGASAGPRQEMPSPAMLRTAFPLPAGAEALRLSLALGAESLRPGEEAWQAGWIQLFSFDSAGRFLWYWPRDVLRVTGQSAIAPASATVPLQPGIKTVMILIYNGAEAGALRAGPPALTYLVERPLARVLRYALVLAWTAAGVWIAHAILRRAARAVSAVSLLAAILITLSGTLMPQPTFRNLSAPLESWALALADAVFLPAPEPVPTPKPPAPEPPAAESPAAGSPTAESPATESPATKSPATGASQSETSHAGRPMTLPPPRPDYPLSFKQLSHFGAFYLLGLAGFLAFPRASWPARLGCLVCFAIVTECLQWFVVTRTGQVFDLVFDGLGLALATLTIVAVTRFRPARSTLRRDAAGNGGAP